MLSQSLYSTKSPFLYHGSQFHSFRSLSYSDSRLRCNFRLSLSASPVLKSPEASLGREGMWAPLSLPSLQCLEGRWFWACYHLNSHWFSRSNCHGVGDWRKRRGGDLTCLTWEYTAWQVTAGPSSWLWSCLFHTWGSLLVGLQGLCFSLAMLWAGRGCWKSFPWGSQHFLCLLPSAAHVGFLPPEISREGNVFIKLTGGVQLPGIWIKFSQWLSYSSPHMMMGLLAYCSPRMQPVERW